MERKVLQVLLYRAGIGLVVLVSSCLVQDYAPDSVRAARARADSLLALGPAGWTDDQLMAYIGLVAATIADDGPAVERRSRSVAVKTFVRSMVASHRELGAAAESIVVGRTPPQAPAISADAFQRHRTTMRNLQRPGPFDLEYVTLLYGTLTEAIARLDQARVPSRPVSIVRVLDRARSQLRSHIGTAAELQRALERGRRPATTPGTNPTKR